MGEIDLDAIRLYSVTKYSSRVDCFLIAISHRILKKSVWFETCAARVTLSSVWRLSNGWGT